MAEGLINKYFNTIEAQSAGSQPSGKVNENAKKVLQKEGAWRDTYHSKPIDAVMDEDFDLVVTVCESAKESCPVFPKKTKVVHVGFEDPDGKPYEAFETLAQEIKTRLFPILQKELFSS